MSALRPGLSLVETTAERLRTDLLSSLRTETLSPGNRILSERQLAQKFGVSYMTARRAVDRLVNEGLLIRKERQGVFVAKKSKPSGDAPPLARVRGIFYLEMMELGYRSLATALEEKLADCDLVWTMLGDRPGVVDDDAIERWDEQAMITVGPIAKSIAEALCRLKRPVVALDHVFDGLPIHQIIHDDEGAACAATERLFDCGHERVAYLAGFAAPHDPGYDADRPPEWPNSLRRAAGMYRAYRERGLPDDALTPLSREWFLEADSKFLRKWLTGAKRPTAVISFSSSMAARLIQGARKIGMKTPDDLSVISFGEQSDEWTNETPELSRLEGNWPVAAAEAVRILRDEWSGRGAPARKIVLPYTWIPGETVS